MLNSSLHILKGAIVSSNNIYNAYKHSIRIAYHSLGLLDDISDSGLGFIEYEEIASLQKEEKIEKLIDSIKFRLQKVSQNLLSEFLDKPEYRKIFFNNKEMVIPLLNRQAVEWYGSSIIYNFDFIVESFVGMHANARTIYDIGGHQGIWAAYYSQLVGDAGRVYSFEPSIINIESSSLLFLINEISNVVNIPFGIGDQNIIIEKQKSEALIDFVDHNIGLLKLENIFFEYPDFIKIDIEGFEYELVKSFSQIFKFCPNIHLELHIPHLQKRGLDYRDIYELIPFDEVKVLNFQNGILRTVNKLDQLDGFCSLLISKKES